MAAYFIAQYVVNDPKLYREYQAGAGPTIQACGGEVVVFDKRLAATDGFAVISQSMNLGR